MLGKLTMVIHHHAQMGESPVASLPNYIIP